MGHPASNAQDHPGDSLKVALPLCHHKRRPVGQTGLWGERRDIGGLDIDAAVPSTPRHLLRRWYLSKRLSSSSLQLSLSDGIATMADALLYSIFHLCLLGRFHSFPHYFRGLLRRQGIDQTSIHHLHRVPAVILKSLLIWR